MWIQNMKDKRANLMAFKLKVAEIAMEYNMISDPAFKALVDTINMEIIEIDRHLERAVE